MLLVKQQAMAPLLILCVSRPLEFELIDAVPISGLGFAVFSFPAAIALLET